MTDLTLLGIAEAGRLMARGEITSTQLTEAFLKRIEAVDHKMRATSPSRPIWRATRHARPTWR